MTERYLLPFAFVCVLAVKLTCAQAIPRAKVPSLAVQILPALTSICISPQASPSLKALLTCYQRHRYEIAACEDLLSAPEDISGRDMRKLVREWLFEIRVRG